MTELPVHPAAEVWPMIPEEELEDLAASIRDVGLLEPIVLTPDGQLLDGRNRAEACRRVGIQPETTTYDGDPVAYVLARNDRRRHMTKGQRAMAAWISVAVANNQQSAEAVAQATGDISRSLVGWAKVVAQDAPELVPVVISGARSLREVYDEIRARRAEAAASTDALDALPEDLATQVREETLTLGEARAAADRRREEREGRIRRSVERLGYALRGWEEISHLRDAAERDLILDALDPHDRTRVLEIEEAIRHGE